MNYTEDKHRYEFAKKRQALNVLNEEEGNNNKYEDNFIIKAPYSFIDNYILNICNSNNNLKLLDYCCGTGLRSITAIQNGVEGYGIDISDESIDVCKKRFYKINPKIADNYIVGNAEKLPYNNDYFDIIISYGSLSYLDFNKAMIEMTRVIKKSGVLIILDTTKNNYFINCKRFIKYKLGIVSKYHIENLFDNNKIKELEENYFFTTHTKYFHFISTLSILLPNISFFNFIKRITLVLDEKIQKTFLRTLFWKFVCILENPKKF